MDVAPVASWTGSDRWLAKGASGLLWLLLLTGPAALLLSVAAVSSSVGARPPAAAPVTVDRSSDAAAAGELAQRLVLAWLTSAQGSEQAVTSLLAPGWSVTLPEVPYQVTEPTTSAIRRVGDVWSVTVAATVTDQDKRRSRQFFLVPVVVDGASVTALALPAPVAGPASGAAVQSLAYRFPVTATGSVAQTVAQFLAAYLTGSGDVTRYVSPGAVAPIAAISPAPYAEVRVTDVRSATDAVASESPGAGDSLRVLAVAEVASNEKQRTSVSYALSLRARAGRWEVLALDLAPQVQGGSPPEQSAPTVADVPSVSPSPALTDAGASASPS